MDRRQVDALAVGIYVIAVLVAVFAFDSAVGPVAAIGGVMLGIYYAAFRRSLPAPTGGRDRDRNPNRNRDS